MSTVFELIISQDIQGNFVWSDEECVVFSTIEPVRPGHMLVVPREPIDKWTDLPPALAAHLMKVSQIIGAAQLRAFDVPRAALLIAGFDVPHTHLHVIPAVDQNDAQLTNAQAVDAASLADDANAVRDALREMGNHHNIPWELNSPASPACP